MTLKTRINPIFQQELEFNYNPRCFLAIEIVCSGSTKHMLGDIMNATILGGIGIVIAKDESIKKSLSRILSYLKFAYENEKGGVKPRNLIIIRADEIPNFFLG